MAKKTVVTGHHRSMALAVAHLEQLQRDNPLATVSIVARRNSSGQFSSNGRSFTFQIVQETKEDLENYFDAYDDAIDYDEVEYESAADYHVE